jgi:hypothetical protein
MRRCYDPGRMSSAPARTLPSVGRVLRGVAWTVLLAVLAASAAGLIGWTFHAPGSPARAELTFAGDAALAPALNAATDRLRRIAADVNGLAENAKTALTEVASSDPTRLRAALEHGGTLASAIDAASTDLLESMAGLPGDGPTAVIEYANATLVRRAAILAAADSAASLAAQWQQVMGRAVDASSLIALIDSHDRTVLDAAAKGRDHQYAAASAVLDEAIFAVSQVQEVRVKLIAGTEDTILDEWIKRTGAYDIALKALYHALDRSRGEITLEVQSARREEQRAFALLPQDRRTIVVIVAEVARGGLTQAVLAIEEAHGRIDDALAEAGEAGSAG